MSSVWNSQSQSPLVFTSLTLPPAPTHQRPLHRWMAAQLMCRGQVLKQPVYQPGTYTSSDGKFLPSQSMGLLGQRYKFEKVIGSGQSSVFIEAKDHYEVYGSVAIKVLNTDYRTLGQQEAECLRILSDLDPLKGSGTATLLDTFVFDEHFCMVFELLHPEPLTFHHFKLLTGDQPVKTLKKVAFHLLKTLGFLSQINFIHADLKPDNILLKTAGDIDSLQVVDFGNTIHCSHPSMSVYYDDFEVQTLLYRAPEVMFGVQLGPEIDMWSYGCCLAELYLGEPIFKGLNKAAVIDRMVEVLGPLPVQPFCRGKFYSQYASLATAQEQENATMRLISMMQMTHDFEFCDFLGRCFQYNPAKRMTVEEAALHPFFASEFGLGFLLPRNGPRPAYYETAHCVVDNNNRPCISQEKIKFKHNSLDLLHQGTAACTDPGETSVVDPAASTVRQMQVLASNVFSATIVYPDRNQMISATTHPDEQVLSNQPTPGSGCTSSQATQLVTNTDAQRHSSSALDDASDADSINVAFLEYNNTDSDGDSPHHGINPNAGSTNQNAGPTNQNGSLIDQNSGPIDQNSGPVDHSGGLINPNDSLINQNGDLITQNGSSINQNSGPIDQKGGPIIQNGGMINQNGGFIPTYAGDRTQALGICSGAGDGLRAIVIELPVVNQPVTLLSAQAYLTTQAEPLQQQPQNLIQENVSAEEVQEWDTGENTAADQGSQLYTEDDQVEQSDTEDSPPADQGEEWGAEDDLSADEVEQGDAEEDSSTHQEQQWDTEDSSSVDQVQQTAGSSPAIPADELGEEWDNEDDSHQGEEWGTPDDSSTPQAQQWSTEDSSVTNGVQHCNTEDNSSVNSPTNQAEEWGIEEDSSNVAGAELRSPGSTGQEKQSRKRAATGLNVDKSKMIKFDHHNGGSFGEQYSTANGVPSEMESTHSRHLSDSCISQVGLNPTYHPCPTAAEPTIILYQSNVSFGDTVILNNNQNMASTTSSVPHQVFPSDQSTVILYQNNPSLDETVILNNTLQAPATSSPVEVRILSDEDATIYYSSNSDCSPTESFNQQLSVAPTHEHTHNYSQGLDGHYVYTVSQNNNLVQSDQSYYYTDRSSTERELATVKHCHRDSAVVPRPAGDHNYVVNGRYMLSQDQTVSDDVLLLKEETVAEDEEEDEEVVLLPVSYN